jgi:hypothetical protein
MKFTPIAELPTQKTVGSGSGIARLAQAIDFSPHGAWLFSYMFRRFGPPNSYSDDHKNLASWCITTPKKECWLLVTPYLGDEGHPNEQSISFGYVLSESLYTKSERAPAHVRKAYKAWWDKVLTWAANRGVSIVTDDQLDRRRPLNRFPIQEEGKPRWVVWSNKKDKPRPVEYNLKGLKSLPIFVTSCLGDAYRKQHKKETPPRPFGNPHVIGLINKALTTTLQELKRPVFVRDLCFNPTGLIEDSELTAAEPYAHAGRPCQPILPKKKSKR